jgi:cell division protein ZipA
MDGIVMEQLTIRDWMVIVGALLILAVLIDAARRVWKERRAEVRLNAKITRTDDDEREEEPFNLLAELPNGGARIVARDDLQPSATPLTEEELGTAPVFSAADPDPTATPGPSDETLLAPGDDDGASIPTETAEPLPAEAPPVPEPSLAPDPAPVPEPEASKPRRGRRQRVEAPPVEGPETLDWLDQLDSDAEPESAEEDRLPRDIDPHVFVLNVVARTSEGFSGADILQILLACDLRFGDMDFFHRHESASGRGPIQFSVANMMNPGVFDIDAMNQLRTRGLMFFLTLPGPEDMLQAFDYMYETAKTVARNLDGDVLDETRSAITRQSLEHMRQQIRELERRLMVERER